MESYKLGFDFAISSFVFFFTIGTYEVGVHIADVSFFIQENSPLDFAAAQRATSVYLVQKVKFPVGYHLLSWLKVHCLARFIKR